jgi:hypothetical protein
MRFSLVEPMNVLTSQAIGFFERESDARTAVRTLLDQGISSYAISCLDPVEVQKPRSPRRFATFFVGTFLGALEAVGFVMAAQYYPELNQFFHMDWQTTVIAGAALGAAGGSIIGLALASVAVDNSPPETGISFVQGTWPSGKLLAVTCSTEQKRDCETVMWRLGAVNLADANDQDPFHRRASDHSSERRHLPSVRRDRQTAI